MRRSEKKFRPLLGSEAELGGVGAAIQGVETECAQRE